ncbi:MAG: hypothetical protein R3D83_01350 [Caenibius sp.]
MPILMAPPADRRQLTRVKDKTMAESTAKPKSTRAKKPKADQAEAAAPAAGAQAKFARAMEEARAGAEALTKEAQERAGQYREQFVEKSKEWQSEAAAYGEQAKVKAGELANEGKSKASDAIASFGKVVADTAPRIDETLGEKYGDYARTAARTMQESAAKLDAKSYEELGEEAKEFVRKSPGMAVGLAAVAGFMIARMLRGSKD